MALPFVASFTGTAAVLIDPPYKVYLTDNNPASSVSKDGSSHAIPTSVNMDCVAIDDSNTYPNAQWCRTTLAATLGGGQVDYMYLVLNATGNFASGNTYLFWYDGGTDGAILKRSTGTAWSAFTTVATSATLGGAASGDVWQFEHDGAGHLAVRKNGISVFTTTDGTPLTGGVAGFGMFAAATAAHVIYSAFTSSQLSGTSALAENADSVSGSGSTGSSFTGAAAIAESSDAVSASGNQSTSGSAAITEGHDTVSASGLAAAIVLTGKNFRTFGPDPRAPWNPTQFRTKQIAAMLAVAFVGSGAIIEGSDTVSASGSQSISGSASITESSDTVSASGSQGSAGTAAITEGSDAVSASGSQSTSGSSSPTESADTISASGSQITSGSATITEGADTTNGSGAIGSGGIAAINEGLDSASGSGFQSISGSGSPTEAADIANGVGSQSTSSSAAITEGADSASGSGSSSLPIGAGAITEGNDSANGIGSGGGANGAGRPRRTIYFVTIDGQRFECRSVNDALALLAKAKETARKLAEDKAMWAVNLQGQTSQPVPIPKIEAPKITVSSRELRSAVATTKREIVDIYEKEFQTAEIRILIELAKRQSDDDESLILLM